GDERLRCLEETARASARCQDGPKRLEELVSIVRKRIPPENVKDVLPKVLGRIAEAVYGTSSWTGLHVAFQEALGQLKPDAQRKVRQQLAKDNFCQVLCHDLVELVLPWNEPKSVQRLNEWRSNYLDPHPPLLNTLRQNVADELEKE